jgi:hypothetical protein
MRTLPILFSALVGAATLLPACGPAYVQVAATTTAPALVEISPGVWIVEDYPTAVYYADGYYWRYEGGVWYRSDWYESGFARVDIGFVPRIVIGSYRPHVHVRYRGHGHRRTIVRDHRSHRHRR